MVTTIVFEGSDGSGKSTLIERLSEHLIKGGRKVAIVGRANDAVCSNITKAIKAEGTYPLPESEILLRLARENERIRIAHEYLAKGTIVILDRGLVSACSWIAIHAQDSHIFSPIIEHLWNKLGPSSLVYCHVPFEVGWQRVLARGQMSRKENLGEEENKKIYDALLKTFTSLECLSVTKRRIDCNQTRDSCFEDLLVTLKI